MESKIDRGQWTSKLGFILAAAGSAVGLGNIWRFPYLTGQNGGAAFVLIYIACVVLVCLPYLITEIALGRFTQKNPIGAIDRIRPRSLWILVGVLCVLTGVAILSYYSVIAGWAFGYIFKTVISPDLPFSQFVSDPVIVLPLFLIFMLMTVLVVVGGVEKGIERWSKVLMPMLVVIMLLIIVRAVTLPGAGDGLLFYLKPDFSKVNGSVFLAAMGQAFFSLSLGMGAMITYGSYLSKKESIPSAALYVGAFDTLVALLAGFMIFPALFAVGESPNAGPALVFIVLPKIFQSLPLGNLVGILFFILLTIAALTSTVSLLEVVVSYFVDERHWSRKRAVWLVGAIAFVIGIPSALSQGASPFFSDLTPILGVDGLFGQKDFLSLMDFFWGNLSLATGALLICVFTGWVWGIEKSISEIALGTSGMPVLLRVWSLAMKYFCPIVIIIVLLNLFGVF